MGGLNARSCACESVTVEVHHTFPSIRCSLDCECTAPQAFDEQAGRMTLEEDLLRIRWPGVPTEPDAAVIGAWFFGERWVEVAAARVHSFTCRLRSLSRSLSRARARALSLSLSPFLSRARQWCETTAGAYCKSSTATPNFKGAYLPNPLLKTPFKRGTVHPFGGCCLADTAEKGGVNHQGALFSGHAGTCCSLLAPLFFFFFVVRL